MRAWLVVLALLSGSQPAIAETDVVAELRAVAHAHRSLERFDVRISVELLPGDSAGAVTRVMEAGAVGLGISRLRTLPQLTLLENPRCWILVDHVSRTIRYEQVGSRLPAGFLDDAERVLAAALQTPERIHDLGRTNRGDRRLAIEPERPGEVRIEMAVDSTSRLLHELRYEGGTVARDGANVRVAYEWRDATQLDESVFSEAQFIKVQGDSIVPVDRFEAYRVLQAP